MSTDDLKVPGDFRVVAHYSREAWAVEFLNKNGARHRTQFTSYRLEADAWTQSVHAYGWCVSGRPYRAETPFECEDEFIAAQEAKAKEECWSKLTKSEQKREIVAASVRAFKRVA